MTQARRSKKSNSSYVPERFKELSGEAIMLLFLAVAIYLFLSLISYTAQDPGWSHSGPDTQVSNLGGSTGAWLADLLFHLFGRVSLLVPFLVAGLGMKIYLGRRHKKPSGYVERVIISLGLIMTVLGACGLEAKHFTRFSTLEPFNAGGYLGDWIAGAFSGAFGAIGSSLFLMALFLAGFTYFAGFSWLKLMDYTGDRFFALIDWFQSMREAHADRAVGVEAKKRREFSVADLRKKLDSKKPPKIEQRVKKEPVISKREEREKQPSLFESMQSGSKLLPPLSLLEKPGQSEVGFSADELQSMSRLLEKKLADFNVEVEVVAVHPGPVITRFEATPAPGVKASQVTNLARDLARAMSVISVRVVENIPGKSFIGIEIPNQSKEIVKLIEGLGSPEYDRANTPLALVLGKDIGGATVIVDLCKMPHVLIAGTTGSGKSVCINALILSILYKSSASDVRMIMIDPKMLELSVYDGIPHLLSPVVTDMNDAANALRWSIVEMERRYKLMSELGVRNISGFNKKVSAAVESRSPILDPLVKDGQVAEELEALPYLVVVIDELADLMMVVGKKVEELITRLAQKGRASGVHLILATQRPSVDVITGLLKANIPTRIAFQVSSKVDSRTIIDQMGAEQLLGHGDMLYVPPGTSLPERVHGSFVSDEEVHEVVTYLKKDASTDYIEEVLTGPSNAGDMLPPALQADGAVSDEDDPLYDQAVELITRTRRASISAVQRHLRVGYNRAARMVETMEAAGVVTSVDESGKRQVIAPSPVED
ncbi:MAG TPA: cell division protein FtsK [Gammaproteobacteria bacterium]|nr:cell division protein FtsK [Gammaproteobacteria bacterium]